jgi:catecholate siderophore receptor
MRRVWRSITENWNINGGYSYLHARIVSGSYFDSTTEQLPNTPPHTFSAWSTYRVIPAVTLGAGAYYRGRQIGYSGGPGGLSEYIDGYWRFDAMVHWQLEPQVGLQLNVQNLADKLYYSKSFYWYALPAAGRTWMLTADFKL